MHNPSNGNFQHLKQVLQYIKGMIDLCLTINQDHYIYILTQTQAWNTNLISWNTKKQTTDACLSIEVEYHSMKTTTVEILRLCCLLQDF